MIDRVIDFVFDLIGSVINKISPPRCWCCDKRLPKKKEIHFCPNCGRSQWTGPAEEDPYKEVL